MSGTFIRRRTGFTRAYSTKFADRTLAGYNDHRSVPKGPGLSMPSKTE